MRRLLVVLGIALVLAGFFWPWLMRLGLGRLPGDIVIQGRNFRFYAPLMTSLIISVVLTLLFWLLRK
ncbi:MAG: DUF2905 domain-containing protein [Alphaproteobacteria bacterium]|nr:DUF2905 family protein [Alphaproteobacteria bacterium]MDE2110463.1 DUF2905 domain-containing protein [Alphaproteobacteria bacterium]MDE2493214.1 DUF2905 domain-containing protein [Alphaproteobacteria bacterium]